MHPFVGLGIALKKRGHRVTVVTSGFFRELIHHVGLEFIEIGTVEEFLALIENPDVWNPRKGFELLLKHAFLPAIRPVYEIIAKHNSRETVVVSSVLMYGARIAHEKLKVPLVTVNLQPAGFWSVSDPPVMEGLLFPRWLPLFAKRFALYTIDTLLDRMLAPEINTFRKEVGLLPIKHIFSKWAHSPQKVIGLFPEWFAAPPPDWPSQTQLTGFISFDAAEEKPLPKEVLNFLEAGEPPVIFTPGTAMLHGKQFFQASIEACKLLKRRALLLTTHTAHLPAQLPEGTAHFDYLPFSALLPHAAALVHHGGIGTAIQALAAGIPQLVRPMNYDQPDNAARLERLGVAVSLSPAKYRGPEVTRNLEYLLSSPLVRESCQRWAEQIDFPSALQKACLAIEQAT